jgi:hypothetical protein
MRDRAPISIDLIHAITIAPHPQALLESNFLKLPDRDRRNKGFFPDKILPAKRAFQKTKRPWMLHPRPLG